MPNRFVTFNEYEAAIINLKKLIYQLSGRADGLAANHMLLNDEGVHTDVVGPHGYADVNDGRGLTVSGSIQDGDIAIVQGNGGGPKWARLPIGDNGRVLTAVYYDETGYVLPHWANNFSSGVVYTLVSDPGEGTSIINATDPWAKFVIPVGAVGDWSHYIGYIASYEGVETWSYEAPREYTFVYSYDEHKIKMFNTNLLGGWGTAPGSVSVTISDNAPSGGRDGDVWLEY